MRTNNRATKDEWAMVAILVALLLGVALVLLGVRVVSAEDTAYPAPPPAYPVPTDVSATSTPKVVRVTPTPAPTRVVVTRPNYRSLRPELERRLGLIRLPAMMSGREIGSDGR